MSSRPVAWPNRAPVAADDKGTVDEDNFVAVNVLANESDIVMNARTLLWRCPLAARRAIV